MITVTGDARSVESRMSAGVLVCPDCSGRLALWGWARYRVIRDGVGADEVGVGVQPRRARCLGCGVTHVLLDDRFALRRADSAAVIAFAIERSVALGEGVRKIAEWVGRPVTTVRGWVRSFRRSASVMAGWFATLLVVGAVDAAAVWPSVSRSRAGQALSILTAYAGAVAVRMGVVSVAWQTVGLTATNSKLLCASFWVGVQHEPALMAAAGGEQS